MTHRLHIRRRWRHRPGLPRRFRRLPLLLLLVATGTTAQTRRHLSVDEAVDLARQASGQVQIAQAEQAMAKANYRQTDAVWLPQVSASYSAMATTNPLNAFGFLLQQGVATAQDFDPQRLNNPGVTHNFGTSIDVKWPLLNLDLLYARKGARQQQEVYKHRLEHTRNHIGFETRKAYAQLQFAYALRDILRSTLEDTRKIHQSVSNFHRQGLVQQSDVLHAQVQVNTVESALAKAESNIGNASGALQLLMGRGAGQPEVYEVDSLAQLAATAGPALVPDTRADLLAMKAAVDASRLMTTSARMALLPRLNAFGSYQLNDSKAFGFHKDAYLAGISLSWTLFSGRQEQEKIKAAKATGDKMAHELRLLRDKSQLELDKTRRDLQDHQHEIVKQRASVSQAAEALRILINRHREGLASTTDCLAAQALLSQQRIALAEAVLNYNITQYFLQFILSTDNPQHS